MNVLILTKAVSNLEEVIPQIMLSKFKNGKIWARTATYHLTQHVVTGKDASLEELCYGAPYI
jgi:hypothetical protein